MLPAYFTPAGIVLNSLYFNDKCIHPGQYTSSGKCKHFQHLLQKRIGWAHGLIGNYTGIA
jgi:hypothetical protein